MFKVRTEEMRTLPEQERTRRLGELVDAARAPRNGQSTTLDGMIRDLEARYEMTSAEMLAKAAHGELHDTADVSRWMILLRARGGG